MDGEARILFDELPAGNGRCLGVATLNAPQTLNGVSLPIVTALKRHLEQWAADPEVVAVVLRGAGDKAFCAGGDLHALYKSIGAYKASGSQNVLDNAYAAEFFAVEYRLDYLIHTYPKPVLAWGHGYVLGGGIGLFAGASHRVVTETSRLAMPEVGIGLYPDVGGSWLLGRVPGMAGRFLALTAAQLNAGDAVFAGLADNAVVHSRQAEVLSILQGLPWGGERETNDRLLARTLREVAYTPEAGPLRRHFDAISDACRWTTVEEAVAAIAALDGSEPWLGKAQAAMAAGAPGSLSLSWEMQERARHLSLADTFRMEYLASLHCAAHGDFGEGIRALLIDKDKRPDWTCTGLAEAGQPWLARFAEAPWPADGHPLADL